MKVLIDNTGLHRVHFVVFSTSARNQISLSDAMALLHFAEHIMFANEMITTGRILFVVWGTIALKRRILQSWTPIGGHSVLIVKVKNDWQDRD